MHLAELRCRVQMRLIRDDERLLAAVLRRRRRRRRTNLAAARQQRPRQPDIKPPELRVAFTQPLEHRPDVVVGVPGLGLLRRQTANERRPHRPADGPVAIPTVEPDRAQRLSAHDHAGELRLRPTLRPRQDRPPVNPAALLINPVGVSEEQGELVIQLDQFACDVTRAVTQMRLDPTEDTPAERREQRTTQPTEVIKRLRHRVLLSFRSDVPCVRHASPRGHQRPSDLPPAHPDPPGYAAVPDPQASHRTSPHGAGPRRPA